MDLWLSLIYLYFYLWLPGWSFFFQVLSLAWVWQPQQRTNTQFSRLQSWALHWNYIGFQNTKELNFLFNISNNVTQVLATESASACLHDHPSSVKNPPLLPSQQLSVRPFPHCSIFCFTPLSNSSNLPILALNLYVRECNCTKPFILTFLYAFLNLWHRDSSCSTSTTSIVWIKKIKDHGLYNRFLVLCPICVELKTFQ